MTAEQEDELKPDAEVLDVLEPPGRRWRWWLGGAGLLALVGVGAASMLGGDADTAWETARATEGALVITVTAVGQLEPLETVEVGSDQSGRIEAVLVDNNDTVKAGQVLARMERERFENTAQQQEAQLTVAYAGLEQARYSAQLASLEAGRAASLLEQSAIAPADAESLRLQSKTADAAARAAAAQVQQASAALERARSDLDDAVIVAPIDGVIIRRVIEPGQTVVSTMQATPLFELASDLTRMRVEVSVDEADVGRVSTNQPALFTVAAWPDRVYEASVSAVDLSPDPGSQVVSYLTDLVLDNSDLSLRPGMTATAEIEVGRVESGALVPAEALRFRPEGLESPAGDHVWLLDGGVPRAVPVDVLGSDGTQAAVEGIDLGVDVLVGEARP